MATVLKNDKDQPNKESTSFLLGCLLVFLVVVITVVVILVLFLNAEFHRGHYPGSRAVPNQNYVTFNLQRQYLRVENAYQSRDALLDIYVWYEQEFGFTDFKRVYEPQGDCLELDRADSQIDVNWRVTVLICETRSGQAIFITRFVSRH